MNRILPIEPARAEACFEELRALIKAHGTVNEGEYEWTALALRLTEYKTSPAGPFDVISTLGGQKPPLVFYLRPDQPKTVEGHMRRIDLRVGDMATVEHWVRLSRPISIGSPTLNAPTLSAQARALKIAAAALETIGTSESDSAEYARDELARVRTLVPEVG